MPSSFRLQLLIFQMKVFGIPMSFFLSLKSLALAVECCSVQDQDHVFALTFSALSGGRGVHREHFLTLEWRRGGKVEREFKGKTDSKYCRLDYGHPKMTRS